MAETIKVVIKEVGMPARAAKIENSLKAQQEIVGGHIECVSLTNDLLLVCNEEGKFLGLETNFSIRGSNNIDAEILDIVCGNVLIVQVKDCDMVDMSDENVEMLLNSFIKRDGHASLLIQ